MNDVSLIPILTYICIFINEIIKMIGINYMNINEAYYFVIKTYKPFISKYIYILYTNNS